VKMTAQVATLISIMLAKTTGHNDTARSAAAAAVARLAAISIRDWVCHRR